MPYSVGVQNLYFKIQYYISVTSYSCFKVMKVSK